MATITEILCSMTIEHVCIDIPSLHNRDYIGDPSVTVSHLFLYINSVVPIEVPTFLPLESCEARKSFQATAVFIDISILCYAFQRRKAGNRWLYS